MEIILWQKKNTTATGSTIDGVTVAHLDNIGKGIKWNDTTKKYEIEVSNNEGNLLEQRDDGIYYGIVPVKEIQNLYVSNNGNDTNAGTIPSSDGYPSYEGLISSSTSLVDTFIKRDCLKGLIINEQYGWTQGITFNFNPLDLP